MRIHTVTAAILLLSRFFSSSFRPTTVAMRLSSSYLTYKHAVLVAVIAVQVRVILVLKLVAWCSGNSFNPINEVTVRRAR